MEDIQYSVAYSLSEIPLDKLCETSYHTCGEVSLMNTDSPLWRYPIAQLSLEPLALPSRNLSFQYLWLLLK